MSADTLKSPTPTWHTHPAHYYGLAQIQARPCQARLGFGPGLEMAAVVHPAFPQKHNKVLTNQTIVDAYA